MIFWSIQNMVEFLPKHVVFVQGGHCILVDKDSSWVMWKLQNLMDNLDKSSKQQQIRWQYFENIQLEIEEICMIYYRFPDNQGCMITLFFCFVLK